jgi:outer membrane protein TolC
VWAANPLTLSEALVTAVNRSQQLVAQDAVAAAAREQAVSAAQMPDPVLKLGVDNLPVNGDDRFSLTNDFMTMRRIGVMQEIPRAQKRQLRGERFERDAQRALAERNVALAAVQRNTAIAWLDRHYTLGMRDLVQQQLQETQLQVQSAQTAFGSGRGSQADVFAARTAVITLQDKLSQMDRQARGTVLMLQRWVGGVAERVPDGPPPWRSVPVFSAPVREHLLQHPDMQVQSALVDTAKTEQQMAQADTEADWSVEVNYAQRGSAYANMLSFGVSIPLQLDRRNRQNRAITAKQSIVLEAQARLDDLLLAHETEQRVLLNDWENGKERLARYNDLLIPTAQQRTQAALTGYRAGKGDLAGVLAARRDEIDTRVQALALEQETARLWAQLYYVAPDTSINNGNNAGTVRQEQP